jgi:hypothetical protein
MLPRLPLAALTVSCSTFLLLVGSPAPLPAQNCPRTSIGSTPLPDLGNGTYRGFTGGLYPNGQNVPPPAHAAAGAAAAAAVRPLDQSGQPSPTGRIVLLSIGMSNTTQEYSSFQALSNQDPNRNSAVTVVDGAQGGQTAPIVADPNSNFWVVVNQRLTAAGVTPQQVQVAWVKEAVAGPTGGFPQHAQALQGYLAAIARNLKSKFPNIRIAFQSSRIYAGYATTSLNPEPYSYESGFAVQWLIAQQIGGDPALNHDPARGPVVAPWLAWGPYLWADGLVPRADGQTWRCIDLSSDGTHPSTSGRLRVAYMLNDHFTGDPYARPWYVAVPGTRAAVPGHGVGCPGGPGTVTIRNLSMPFVGNLTFRHGVGNAALNAPASMLIATQRGAVVLDGWCTAWLAPASLVATIGTTTTSAGAATLQFAVPNDQSLVGLVLPSQWLVLDPAAPGLRVISGASMSDAFSLRIGT